jgi:hypothetical protein
MATSGVRGMSRPDYRRLEPSPSARFARRSRRPSRADAQLAGDAPAPPAGDIVGARYRPPTVTGCAARLRRPLTGYRCRPPGDRRRSLPPAVSLRCRAIESS